MMELEIIKENSDEIIAFCPFHKETRASFLVNKSGPFAGEYRCWGCGRSGPIADLGLERTVKKTRRKKKKTPREMHSIWLEHPYAEDWIVSTEHLRSYGIKWNETEQCWLCPMLNPKGQICGLQRRFKNGRKICVSGSKLGVFATSAPRQDLLVICEGLSDTIAAANLGFDAIGRPSALVMQPVVDWVTKAILMDTRVVVVSDSNEIERKSAEILGEKIGANAVLYPRNKDLSEDVAAGLGQEWGERIVGYLTSAQ